jgi:hypothetical protein
MTMPTIPSFNHGRPTTKAQVALLIDEAQRLYRGCTCGAWAEVYRFDGQAYIRLVRPAEGPLKAHLEALALPPLETIALFLVEPDGSLVDLTSRELH